MKGSPETRGKQVLLDEKGPEWVWQNRQRLAAERVFIREF